jgi:hypothetical protein
MVCSVRAMSSSLCALEMLHCLVGKREKVDAAFDQGATEFQVELMSWCAASRATKSALIHEINAPRRTLARHELLCVAFREQARSIVFDARAETFQTRVSSGSRSSFSIVPMAAAMGTGWPL